MRPRLTLGQIQKAKNQNRYIAVRDDFGVIGINCSMPITVPPGQEDCRSIFQSWKPISFMEYIRIKVPYIITRSFVKAV